MVFLITKNSLLYHGTGTYLVTVPALSLGRSSGKKERKKERNLHLNDQCGVVFIIALYRMWVVTLKEGRPARGKEAW
jgi:hypothetical protein